MFSSCITIEEQKWNDVKDSRNIEDILDFAENNQNGKFFNEADRRIKEMINRQDDPQRLLALLNKYPDYQWADDLKDRISELAFETAFSEHTLESLEEYIAEFSGYGKNTTYVNQARTALNIMYTEIAREQR